MILSNPPNTIKATVDVTILNANNPNPNGLSALEHFLNNDLSLLSIHSIPYPTHTVHSLLLPALPSGQVNCHGHINSSFLCQSVHGFPWIAHPSFCSGSSFFGCVLPGVLISFLWFFVVRKHIILKGNSFFVYTKYWPSDSTHFAHLPGKLWIPRQKNCFCFTAKHSLSHFHTSLKLLKCCSASAYPIDEKRW